MIRWLNASWLSILILIPTSTRADSSSEALDHLNRGFALSAEGNIDGAIAEYTEAIRLDAKDPRPYGNRGYAYLLRREVDRAITDLNAALQLDPNNSTCHKLRGDAHSLQGDSATAIADYNQAQRLAPRDANIYFCRGAAYGEQKDLARALADFNEAIRLAPQFAVAYYNRGNVHMEKKDYRSSIADFQEAIRLAPQHPFSYFALAHLLASCPKVEFRDGRKAMEYAKKGCELTQWRNAGGLDSLAVAFGEIGDCDKAVYWEEKALELARDFPRIEQEKMKSRLQLFKQGKPYRAE